MVPEFFKQQNMKSAKVYLISMVFVISLTLLVLSIGLGSTTNLNKKPSTLRMYSGGVMVLVLTNVVEIQPYTTSSIKVSTFDGKVITASGDWVIE
jgi:hypothetical protein